MKIKKNLIENRKRTNASLQANENVLIKKKATATQRQHIHNIYLHLPICNFVDIQNGAITKYRQCQ